MTHRPPDIVRTAYVEVTVTDLERAHWFWVELLGFVVSGRDDEALYLRGYDEATHHCLVLRLGPEPACSTISFRVRTPGDVEAAEAYFSAAGHRTRRVQAGTHRGVGDAVRVEDPLGFTIEFFHETDVVDRLHQRYDLRRGAEVSRIDHANIVVPDIAAAYAHYTGLGFGLSESIEDDHAMYAAWMFRKQTVHDIAFTKGGGPRLHHIGFATAESHQVLRTCDLFGSLKLEHHIERGPGRHGVSNAFYVYLRDPDGHRLEIYTSDYFTGDPDHVPLRWDVHDPRRRDFWANPVVPSWYAEATTVLDLDGKPRPIRAAEWLESEVVVGADGVGIVPSHRE